MLRLTCCMHFGRLLLLWLITCASMPCTDWLTQQSQVRPRAMRPASQSGLLRRRAQRSWIVFSLFARHFATSSNGCKMYFCVSNFFFFVWVQQQQHFCTLRFSSVALEFFEMFERNCFGRKGFILHIFLVFRMLRRMNDDEGICVLL